MYTKYIYIYKKLWSYISVVLEIHIQDDFGKGVNASIVKDKYRHGGHEWKVY